MNRRTAAINADGVTLAAYAYDDAGNLTKMVDAKNDAGTGNIADLSGEVYAYDDYDQVVSKTDALGNPTSYIYDLRGNLTSETDARNQVLLQIIYVINKNTNQHRKISMILNI